MPVKLVNASILKAAREDMLPNNSYKLPDAVNHGSRKSRLLTNGGIIETEGSNNRRPTQMSSSLGVNNPSGMGMLSSQVTADFEKMP
jgi:hypothetical protein